MSLFSSNEEHFCTPFALHNKTNTAPSRIEINRLEPENDYGNTEYKLRLNDPTPERIEKLVTQLKWRIREGNGEAIVFLGVRDDGLFVGLTPEERRLSLQTLELMTAKIGAKMEIVSEIKVETTQNNKPAPNGQASSKAKAIKSHKQASIEQRSDNDENVGETLSKKHGSIGRKRKMSPMRKVIQVLVKRKTHDISEELRVAVLGPSESGKSSLLGVLSHGECDNGRGSARLNLFRHRHEIRSGHTSSISQEIFGFNHHGQPLTYQNCLSTEEIIESSSKIVTLIDLAGHQRYLNTTLFGLVSHCPDLILLIVDATSPVTNVTESVSLALGLSRPFAIIINKIDLTTNYDQDTCYEDLKKVLHLVDPEIETLKVRTQNEAKAASLKFRDPRVVSIFFSSCLTGLGMDTLYAFFNDIAPMLDSSDLDHAVNQTGELLVDDTFEVPGIGTVVSGLIIGGILREGDKMFIGPDDDAKFHKVSILSLQRHKIPCNYARAGHKCTMAIQTNGSLKVRRGMVMKEVDTDESHSLSACLGFEARIRFIGKMQNKFAKGSHVSVYAANVKQTCTIESIKQLAGEFWLIHLRLAKRPEYVRECSKIVVRLGSTKAVGEIHRVEPMNT